MALMSMLLMPLPPFYCQIQAGGAAKAAAAQRRAEAVARYLVKRQNRCFKKKARLLCVHFCVSRSSLIRSSFEHSCVHPRASLPSLCLR